MLAWTIYLSFAGALVLALLPSGTAGRHGDQALARWLALAVAVAGLALAVQGFVAGMGHGRVIITDVAWVPSMGVHYLLAADGISRVLVLLTGLAAVAGVLFSWNIELRTNQFFAFFLALIGGVYGVFLSFDLFLLFVFYEIAIVPKYFLIAIWGSTRREYAAMKLALYSFLGSAMVLIGLLAAYATAGSHSTGLIALAHAGLPVSFQMWCFPLVFTGFAILAGMWPFHTWAPTGHVAAPTAASMLLAGVVM
jgi:NADH-quinone oxidoreductase subunit M